MRIAKSFIIRLIDKIDSLRFERMMKIGNVLVGTNNRISNQVVIDTKLGGQIIIGSDNEVLHGVLLMSYGGTIHIGDRCSINPYTIIYGHGKGTIIGNDVLIAGQCMFIPANHKFDDLDKEISKQGLESIGIVVEDNVWIGSGVKVLDGVRIGKGSVVAAGSVITKNIPPYSIVAGVPGKIIRNRINNESLKEI